MATLTDGVVTLATITVADVTKEYVNWLNDPEVNRWLETRWKTQTVDTVREYLAGVHARGDFLWAITANGKHIGNIKLSSPHPIHQSCDIAYFIGDRAEWGKGYATRAVRVATGFALGASNVHRVQAGCYAANRASVRVLLKAGFSREGERVRALKTENGWDSELLFARLAGGSAL